MACQTPSCLAVLAILLQFLSVESVLMTPKQILLQTFGAGTPTSLLLCPESLTPLTLSYRSLGPFEERFLCSNEYGSRYKQDKESGIWDMTISAEQDKPWWQVSRREQISSRLFQTPLLSAIYERGYRQNFENAGFPGIDKEYAEAEAFFLGGEKKGGVVMDLSCGSGFMTRRFIKSGKFSAVLSADLSKTMLGETARRCDEEGIPRPDLLVRADAARLPFPNNSLDSLHAGAAMHCWPRLPEALSEVYRVLKPGGKFYASTFFNSLPNVISQRRGGSGAGGFYLFEDREEVESFVRGAGFEEYDVRKEGQGCAIVRAQKVPSASV